MIIQSSNIGMGSSRTYRSTTAGYRAANIWGTGSSANMNASTASLSAGFTKTASYTSTMQHGGSSFTRQLLDRFNNAQVATTSKIDNSISSIRNMHQQIFDHMINWIFGGRLPSQNMSESYSFSMNSSFYSADFGMDMGQGISADGTSASYFNEEEATTYSTTGTVVTADGRRIDFNMDVSMSRSFTRYAQENLNFTSPKMTDPLVINLDSNIADVSDQKFYFDLDADGHEEYISMLNAGSGFLALDKNGDGIINDGSELFGTASGDGFADLAKYDSDGNGWIDENDPIFDQLLIWRKNADGTDSLCSIGKAGVGAIYLGSSDTQFSLTSGPQHTTNAQIRKTGMFLYENGNVGTVQHLDLAQ